MDLLSAWARAFAVTWLIELAVALPVLGGRWKTTRRLATVSLAQAASHPAVWFIFPLFLWRRPLYLAVAESWAVLLEAAVYRLALPGLSWRRALASSFLANAASFAVGAFLRLIWPTF